MQPDSTPTVQEECYEPVVANVPGSPRLQHVLVASQAFAKADDRVAAWQLGSTLACLAGALAVARFATFTALHPFWVVLLSGLFVRTFVLQHDCGHLSFFSTRRANDLVGTCLAFLTGVPYHGWRTEHNWHHAHQGKLSRRGVDSNNSPPTVAEAIENPKSSQARAKIISPAFIFGMGPLSLMVFRKRVKGFFFFREAYQAPVPDVARLRRSVWLTNAGHAVFIAAMVAWLGPLGFLTMMLPAMMGACGVGALLFWVQHNFEHTYFAHDGEWDFARAGLHGSSYLRLPAVLAWFTAHIGVHHVHHVNVRIPNYRLEEARAGVPEIAAIAPLSWPDFKRCFECLFWDESGRKLVTLGDVQAGQELAEVA